MKCKTFNYKNYNNCTFCVNSYLYNKMAMAIQIIDENEETICTCSVYRNDYMYYPGSATIKNYSENSGMTKFLQKLGIIEQVYNKIQCNPYATKSETIDFCDINMKKLKEYSSQFNFEYDFE